MAKIIEVKTKSIKTFTYILVSFSLYSCNTPSIRFQTKSNQKTKQIVLLPIGDQSGVGENLGTTPIDIELSNLKDKMLRIEQDDEIQYWIFPSLQGSQNTVTLNSNNNIAKKPMVMEQENSVIQRNQTNRLLLKSYQALSKGENNVAKELANQAKRIDSRISAPYILLGLVYLGEKDYKNAKTNFQVAKTLDPADIEIDKLIESMP